MSNIAEVFILAGLAGLPVTFRLPSHGTEPRRPSTPLPPLAARADVRAKAIELGGQ